jgi:hypothetical protein
LPAQKKTKLLLGKYDDFSKNEKKEGLGPLKSTSI